MPEIIEPHIGLPAPAAIRVEITGLGAGHVRAQPGEKNDSRRRTGNPAISDCGTIITRQDFWRIHRGLAVVKRDRDDTTMPARSEDRPFTEDRRSAESRPSAQGRPPAVLQVIPRLVSGGAERGSVEVAEALTAAGWNAYVASAGGPLEHLISRSGATHLTLPVASKNPLVMRRNVAALARVIRHFDIDIVHARSRAPAWSAW